MINDGEKKREEMGRRYKPIGKLIVINKYK